MRKERKATMKGMKKLLAFALAAVMMTAVSLTGFAVEPEEMSTGTKGAVKTITITKPEGITQDAVYEVYKVFDATQNGESGDTAAISYRLLSGVTEAPDGFTVDDAGNVYLGTTSSTATGAAGEIAVRVNGEAVYITPQTDELTQTQINAIASYAGKELIGKVTVTEDEDCKTVTVSDYGYYYITTSTGTCVTVDSTNPNADVEDKNTPAPAPEKIITSADSLDAAGKKALAEVGTTVCFSVTLEKVKGAVNYVFHDVMSAGLEYQDDVAVKIGDKEIKASETVNTTADGETFTVRADDQSLALTFDNDWLADLDDSTEITVTYSAIVTGDALSTDPANNTAKLDYGNGYTTDSDTVEVYNGKFTVKKQDEKEKPLAGAGFVVAKNDGSALVYYKLADGVVTWVKSIDDATEYTSNAEGEVTSFTGLADGTYTLIEKTVPAGYNKAEDTEFTIKASDYEASNLEQSATVTNNIGVELPTTGGIGTTIFYLIGSILVIGAGIVLVAKRRMAIR